MGLLAGVVEVLELPEVVGPELLVAEEVAFDADRGRGVGGGGSGSQLFVGERSRFCCRLLGDRGKPGLAGGDNEP